MSTVHAVYENGVFRPLEEVNLPECAEVEFEPRVVELENANKAAERLYDVLAESFDADHVDLAERHNEHQP